jgi:hypothetical protein
MFFLQRQTENESDIKFRKRGDIEKYLSSQHKFPLVARYDRDIQVDMTLFTKMCAK